MSQRLTSNQWGFSVEKDNPFAIFRKLQEVARDSVGAANVIDLSRGDPGYGFTPSVAGRRFFSYLVLLDSYMNHDQQRFSNYVEEDYNKIMADIVSFTEYTFNSAAAGHLIGDLGSFIDSIQKMALECGMEWSRFDVLKRLFNLCPISGGSYLNPQGEEIVRVVLANWYRQFISTPINHSDLILFNGASHAIGTVFKALGAAGVNYLNDESTVVICSPAYSPYNASLLNRSIKTFSLSMNPITGEIDEDSMAHLEKYEEKIHAIILIDPNNPTGFSISEAGLEKIAKVAEKHDSIIISDEVYSSFFDKKKTIVDYAPERTLRIDARSKIERSTGLRFGDMFISAEANKHISENILKDLLLPDQDIKSLLMQAKGPGGVEGELQHTTFVPGPAQFLGICHMVMGGEERELYFKSLRSNSKVFIESLGLEYKGNLYYVIFDFDKIEGTTKKEVPVEEKLLELAKRGVIYLPVYLFFSEYERAEKASVNMVRASVVNTSVENIEKAAKITKEYLNS